jgi:hypothetical protein
MRFKEARYADSPAFSGPARMICSSSSLLSAGCRRRSIAAMTESTSVHVSAFVSGESGRRKLTRPQNLQPAGFAIQRPGNISHTLARSLKPAKTCLDLFGQLSSLIQARIEDIDFGPRLLIQGVERHCRCQPNRHCDAVLDCSVALDADITSFTVYNNVRQQCFSTKIQSWSHIINMRHNAVERRWGAPTSHLLRRCFRY